MLIDMNQPEIDVRPIRQMTGDTEFCEVFLDGAYVASEGLLGDAHSGWQVATSVLADERAAVGAASIRLDRRLVRLGDDPGTELRDRGLPFAVYSIGQAQTLGWASLEACDDRVRNSTQHALFSTRTVLMQCSPMTIRNRSCTLRGCALLEAQAKCNGILLANDCSAFHVHPNRRHLEWRSSLSGILAHESEDQPCSCAVSRW